MPLAWPFDGASLPARAWHSCARLLRTLLRAVWRRRRLRAALLAGAVLAALLAGGWIGLRHSSLSAVRHVQISGVSGRDARAIDSALTAAARRMSTLDVHPAALRAAVAPFVVVREVRASASFPHGLRIHVVEQLPVAALQAAGARTAVAADGVVLGPSLLSGSLPTLAASSAPAPGRRVAPRALTEALTVLGAAPARLARLVARAYSGTSGLTLVMRNGLDAYFGDASRPHAKWLALALVLGNERSAGASYVDVRVPERPAAGAAAGFARPSGGEASTSATASESSSSAESTAAALAAGLAKSVGPERASGAAAQGQGSEESSAPRQAGSGSEATR